VSETVKPSTPVPERLPNVASPPAAPEALGRPPVAAPQTGDAPATVISRPPNSCLDCGAPLSGKYCIACGQRAQVRSLSLPSLAHDALQDFTNFDSRAWTTLRALLMRPGFLTNEFVQGRRTRYLPPFRLYLVLSLVFFVVLSCKPSEDTVVIGGDGSGNPAIVVTGADPKALDEAMKDLNRELGPTASSDPKAQAAAKTAIAVGQAVADPDSPMILESNCKQAQWDGPGKDWIEPRMKSVCEHLKGVTKRQFGRELFSNVPKMMFVFLPLLALVNLILYAFRRRKYVEHLLFYVHYHAFAFLLVSLQMLLSILFRWLEVPYASGLLAFAATVYLFAALFKAMRTVYGQSRLMTAFKYLIVLMAYGVFSLATFLGTLFYTAMTV
jgi:hypothetical protein